MVIKTQARETLKKSDKTINLTEIYSTEIYSKIFKENLTSFEYFFFSITLLVLAEDLNGFVSGIVIGLALFLFFGGVATSSTVRYIRRGIEYKSRRLLLAGLFLLLFISLCFLVIIFSLYRPWSTSSKPLGVRSTLPILPFAFRYYSYTAHGAILVGRDYCFKRVNLCLKVKLIL